MYVLDLHGKVRDSLLLLFVVTILVDLRWFETAILDRHEDVCVLGGGCYEFSDNDLSVLSSSHAQVLESL